MTPINGTRAGEDEPASTGAAEGSFGGAIQALTELLTHKGLIAKATAISMVLGLATAFLLPVRYTAIARIMPPKQPQSGLSILLSQAAPGMGALAESAGGLGLRDPNAIYIGLLKSRPVADKIIERFDLMKVYRSRDMTGARKKLEKYTVITSEKSTLISISVTDRDKKRAADMANAYTEILREVTRSVSVTEASRRRLALEEQLKDAKEDLAGAEVAFEQLQQSKGLVRLDTQAAVIIGSAAGVRAQIAAKQVELQTLRSFSTENNPDVQLAERELSALQAQGAQLEEHSRSTGFSDLGLKDVPKAGLDYVRASRELQYQQAFFDVLVKEYEAARLDEAKEGAVVQVVEPAIPADRRSEPKRLVILLLFTLTGFSLSCLFVRLRSRYREELADPARAGAIRELKRAAAGLRFPLR